eukprot:2057296-Pleurochrysis_carterae.AAC.2
MQTHERGPKRGALNTYRASAASPRSRQAPAAGHERSPHCVRVHAGAPQHRPQRDMAPALGSLPSHVSAGVLCRYCAAGNLSTGSWPSREDCPSKPTSTRLWAWRSHN